MRWLITLTLLVSMAASADTYRWVNYSDIPHLGAERIELGQVQTTPFAAPAQRPAPPSTSGSGSGSGDDGAAYQSISIQRPKPEETLWNIEGRLDVAVSVQPGLNASHRLALYLDGQAVAGIPAGATSFTIDKVYRGMHTLRAAVRDSGGRELGSSQAMRFYVQQTSGDNKKSGPTPSPRPRPRS